VSFQHSGVYQWAVEPHLGVVAGLVLTNDRWNTVMRSVGVAGNEYQLDIPGIESVPQRAVRWGRGRTLDRR
jgi:hypothetical protein